MGGMGRTFDGGYAEYTVVPRQQVIAVSSNLPWKVIGAVPSGEVGVPRFGRQLLGTSSVRPVARKC